MNCISSYRKIIWKVLLFKKIVYKQIKQIPDRSVVKNIKKRNVNCNIYGSKKMDSYIKLY